MRTVIDSLQVWRRRRENGQAMAEYTLIIGAISIFFVGLFVVADVAGAIGAQVTSLAAHITPGP
jgi:Flp pilus assembly pilin Flp